MSDIREFRDIVLLIGAFIAVISLILSFLEYRRQGSQKRAEHFLEIRNRLKNDPRIQNIGNCLEVDDPELLKIPFIDKRDFLGLFNCRFRFSGRFIPKSETCIELIHNYPRRKLILGRTSADIADLVRQQDEADRMVYELRQGPSPRPFDPEGVRGTMLRMKKRRQSGTKF